MDKFISENARKLLKEIPPGVLVEAAAKTRTAGEALSVIEGGIKIIAHNYVQEAEKMKTEIGDRARWHLIGPLQKNKVRKAVKIFDMIETVDSSGLLHEIEKRCSREGLNMPVLVQVNIGGEDSKSGVPPGAAGKLFEEAQNLGHVRAEGLMTIEPFTEKPEEARKYFRMMKELFDELKSRHPGIKYLSMGMSRTYKIAVDEGANMVRLGTCIFGESGTTD